MRWDWRTHWTRSVRGAGPLALGLAFAAGCGQTRGPGVDRSGDAPTDASVRDAVAPRMTRPDASASVGAGGSPERNRDAGGRSEPPPIFDAGSVEPEPDAASDAASEPDSGVWVDACGHRRPDVFADEVIAFTPGPSAGFGAPEMPCVVLGPPIGGGPNAGSLDVVSLGKDGSIVLAFDDVELVDGPGPDLIVFENAFPGWIEPGFVAVSDDGATWHEWPCDPSGADAGTSGCAGVHATLSNPKNGISPTDPAVAGGDAFDLAALGVTRARFVRIRDGGFSHYGGTSGGFDLDAIAAVRSIPRTSR